MNKLSSFQGFKKTDKVYVSGPVKNTIKQILKSEKDIQKYEELAVKSNEEIYLGIGKLAYYLGYPEVSTMTGYSTATIKRYMYKYLESMEERGYRIIKGKSKRPMLVKE